MEVEKLFLVISLEFKLTWFRRQPAPPSGGSLHHGLHLAHLLLDRRFASDKMEICACARVCFVNFLKPCLDFTSGMKAWLIS